MVSNALNLDIEELLDVLRHIKKSFARSPEYKELRQDLPADWPM
jgi:hypothetical protein